MISIRSSVVLAVIMSNLCADNFILKDEDLVGYTKPKAVEKTKEDVKEAEPQKVFIEDINPNSKLAKATEQTQKDSSIKSVLFDYDKHAIRDDMKTIVDGNIEAIKNNTKIKTIKLEGNADERGSDEYNYALALKRVNSVKAYYTSTGIEASKISVESLGEGSPVCEEHGEDCWAKNRRVDTKIGE